MSKSKSKSKINVPIPEDEDKLELEHHFVLRLPTEEAKYVHNLLQEKPRKLKKGLKIEMDDDMRNGTVYVKKKPIPARLVDLPTITEVSKSVNNVNLYKVADISQMLLCEYPEEKKNVLKDGEKYIYPHGLAPPMKNVRKEKFRKTIKNHIDMKEVADIQKEVALLLRADSEAVAVKYELIKCDKEEVEPEITEQMLFGSMSSDSETYWRLLLDPDTFKKHPQRKAKPIKDVIKKFKKLHIE